jgi:hypothetical protein
MKYVWPKLEKYVSRKPPAIQRKLCRMNWNMAPGDKTIRARRARYGGGSLPHGAVNCVPGAAWQVRASRGVGRVGLRRLDGEMAQATARRRYPTRSSQ